MHHLRLTRFSLILSLAACGPLTRAETQGPPPSAAAPSTQGPAPSLEFVDSVLATLSTRERIGQLVVPWVAGTYAAFDDEALSRAAAWVDSLHVGGIIVSVGSPLDIAAKLNHLQRRSRLPLLVAADFESGTAIRLIGGTPFPTNMGVAATGSESDAYDVGRITALEGRAVGVHLTFAPVADVNNNPANPIINVRSFGEDPRRVARLTAAGVRGMQDHGMRATAKHFPGHGDTGTDSHVELPTITAGWPRLDTLELIPFRAAIEAGVTAIMSAHIAIPELDGGRMRPATLSPGILKSVLRDSLGFDGIVVTDALTMGGVVNKYGAGEAVVLSFLAGADLLLQPVDPAVAVGAMEQAVSSGRISHDRLEQSVRRVLALKAELGLFTRRQVSLDSVPVVVGAESFQLTARDVTARSLVLARDEGAAVARLRQGPSAVSLILLADERNVTLGRTLATELRAGGYAVESFVLWPHSGPASYDSARATIARTPTSIFMTAVRPTPWASTIDLPVVTAQLVDSTAQQRPTILISLGSPYVVTQTPHVGSFLLGWVARPGTEEAVARALNGTSRLSGTLPISVPPILPLGAGVRLERP